MADETIISVAERIIEQYDIAPLYYEMKKATSGELNIGRIYEGLVCAFTGSNIGLYSNNISKIWNSEPFVTGSYDEKEKALNIIKLLCAENNHIIDFAKTLYKPVRPVKFDTDVKNYTKCMLPHYFVYAKDKDIGQVEPPNKSMVNRIGSMIPKQRMTDKYIGRRTKEYLSPINWRLLLSDHRITEISGDDSGLLELYRRCLKECPIRYTEKLMQKIKGLFVSGVPNTRQGILFGDAVTTARGLLSTCGLSKEDMTDRLVYMLYVEHENMNRELLWACYGDVLLENLKRSLSSNNSIIEGSENVCLSCGKRFVYSRSSGCSRLMCAECYAKEKRAYNAGKQREYRKNKRE